MATKVYIYTDPTWVDVTSYVQSLKFTDKGKEALNKLEVAFKRNIIETTENPTYQTEIRLEIDGTIEFGGKIEKPESEFPFIDVLAYSYGTELLDKFINEVYESQGPEDIVDDIITNDTDLTYASTGSSGITIDRIKFRDKKISEVFSVLADLVGWTFYTDYQKNAYFEPLGETNSGLTLTVGTNVANKPTWDYNADWVINKVIVEGDKQSFNTNQLFSGTGTTTEFDLTYEPDDTIIKVGGVEMPPEVEGSTTTGSYTINKEGKKVVFNAAPGSGADNISVDYNYLVPIRVIQTSETTHTRKELKVKNKSIKSYAEARKIGRDILSLRSQPKKGAKLNIYGWDSNLKAGNLINVVDSTETDSSGSGLNESLLITQVEYVYPNEVTSITVGTNIYEIYSMLRDIQSKIRELGQEDSNQDILQQYHLFSDIAKVNLLYKTFIWERTVNDSWIWGKAKWGETNLGDRREGDTFTSHGNGTYNFTDIWGATGSYSIDDGDLLLGSAATTSYKGRDLSGNFTQSDIKVKLDYEKRSSTNFYLYLRKADSDNYYLIDFDHSNNQLRFKKNVAGGGVTQVSTETYNFGTYPSLTIRATGTYVSIYDTTTMIIDSTETFLSAAGIVELEAVGDTVAVNEIEIYEGD